MLLKVHANRWKLEQQEMNSLGCCDQICCQCLTAILQECQFSNLRMPRFGRTADHLPLSSKRNAPICVTTQVAEVQAVDGGLLPAEVKTPRMVGFPEKSLWNRWDGCRMHIKSMLCQVPSVLRQTHCLSLRSSSASGAKKPPTL